MSDQDIKGKQKYESPILVPLGEMAKGSGACGGGSSVITACTAGSNVGTVYDATGCTAGITPVDMCTAGTTAQNKLGSYCSGTGNSAETYCSAGVTAVLTYCSAGTTAGAACTAGTNPA
ncbi:MAG: hypothetical protein NT033_00485 [Candidatus Omnitrophica bacterium]|nr:hypothetical protein [Candidatus Omnitrophota bacterium]